MYQFRSYYPQVILKKEQEQDITINHATFQPKIDIFVPDEIEPITIVRFGKSIIVDTLGQKIILTLPKGVVCKTDDQIISEEDL